MVESEVLAGVAPSIAAVAGIAFQWWRHGGQRNALIGNLDVYERFPESDTRTRLLDHISQQVAALIDDEGERRRDPAGIVLALVFLALGGWLTLYGFGRDTWQWAFAVPGITLLIFGVFGFATDVARKKWDERGRVIE